MTSRAQSGMPMLNRIDRRIHDPYLRPDVHNSRSRRHEDTRQYRPRLHHPKPCNGNSANRAGDLPRTDLESSPFASSRVRRRASTGSVTCIAVPRKEEVKLRFRRPVRCAPQSADGTLILSARRCCLLCHLRERSRPRTRALLQLISAATFIAQSTTCSPMSAVYLRARYPTHLSQESVITEVPACTDRSRTKEYTPPNKPRSFGRGVSSAHGAAIKQAPKECLMMRVAPPTSAKAMSGE